jgi:uncharacterized protein (TIGR02246 family)
MSNDARPIHALIEQYCDAALRKDAEAMPRLYDADVRIFDLWDRPSVRGQAEWAPTVRRWLGGLGTETVHVTFEEVEIRTASDLATVTAFVRYQARDQAGAVLRQMVSRLTWSLARRDPDWRIIHQHTSIPIDSQSIAPKFNG